MRSTVMPSSTAVSIQTERPPQRLFGARAAKSKQSFLRDVRLLQAFAIILVVFVHAVIPGTRFTGLLELFDRFARTSVVPLFICITGFLYHYTGAGNKAAGLFLRERAYRLLLPYASLST